MSDRLEIADVLTRYTRAIDFGEWDLLDTVFPPDADVDYTQSGGIHDTFATVKPWLAEMLPAFFTTRMHTIGQVHVAWAGGEPGADAAEVTAYFDNPMTMDDGQGGTKVAEVGGMYLHSMVRTPAGWRSKQLVERVIWKRGI